MISHEYKCIFVHIPRCGGGSIEDVIWPEPRSVEQLWKGKISDHCNKYQTGGMQHLYARHIREEVGKSIFNSYFKFAIVRNPWDRVVSQFALTRRKRVRRQFLGISRFGGLTRYLRAIQKIEYVHWAEQYKFLFDDSGALLVDYVGRFEQLEEAFGDIAKSIGLKTTTLPYTSKSKHGHYSTYYDDFTRDWVAKIYAKDIELFDYKFEGCGASVSGASCAQAVRLRPALEMV